MSKSKNWEEKYLRAKYIGEKKLIDRFDELVDFLEDENENVRISAIEAIKNIGSNEGVEPLLQALADPNHWIRVKIVETLGIIGNKNLTNILSQFLQGEENEKVKATIIKVLGKLGGEEMVPIIVSYLSDKKERIRANAVEALGKIGNLNLSSKLSKLLKDKNHRVKANAAEALWKFGDEVGFETLKEMFFSEDDWMRASAAFCLGNKKDQKAADLLSEGLGDNCWFVNKNIVNSLIRLGKLSVKKLNEKFINETNLRYYIAIILGDIGNKSTIKILSKGLNDDNGDVREQCEIAIDKIYERLHKNRKKK
jgi:HEAT repeat protein